MRSLHSRGLDVLGAVEIESEKERIKRITKVQRAAERAQLNRILAGVLVGVVVGAGAGALFWTSRRILGAVIGSVLLGIPGFVVGKKIGTTKMHELMQ